MKEESSAIEILNLVKSYGSVLAVNGISLSVKAGEIFGMLVPNGAGKTTTVEILVGLLRRDQGEVRVLGHDPEKNSRYVKSRIGVQLQTTSLFPRLTVKEVVGLYKSFFPDAKHNLPEKEVIARVGLEDKTKAAVQTLSGGQLQRLAIALAMVNNGQIVFLDEPTTGLDPQARRNLWDVILNLKKEGKTVFLTTHYMEEAERLCDRVGVIDNGEIIALDSPAELVRTHFKERAIEFHQPILATNTQAGQLPGVKRVQIEEDKVTLYSTEVAPTVAALMELSTNEGVSIDDIVVRQATLEDVFLKLTGRRIRD